MRKEKLKNMIGELIKTQVSEILKQEREKDKEAMESYMEEVHASYNEKEFGTVPKKLLNDNNDNQYF